MDIALKVNTFQICRHKRKTVLVMNGSFVCYPGSLKIKLLVNGSKKYDTHAYIIPEEQGKGTVKHHFEFEYKVSEETITSLELLLIDNEEKETALIRYDEPAITEHSVNTSVIYQISSVSFNENQIGTVFGWAYSTLHDSIQYMLIDEEGKQVNLSLRKTIIQRLAERGSIEQKDSLCGFIISFEGSSQHQYQIVLKDKECTMSVSLNKYILVQSMDANKAVKLLHMINKRNIQRGIRFLKKNGIGKFFSRLSQGVTEEMDYDAWFKRNHISQEELRIQRDAHFSYEPKISIIVPTFNTPVSLLHEMIQSVMNQSYTNWELCIADGSDNDSEARRIILDYQKKDQRIKVTLLNENYGISGNTNKALELAVGEYTGLFDHDDLLEPDILFEVISSLQGIHHDIIYTDEDKLNDQTHRLEDPNFKPDYNEDLFLSHNYITHFFVVRTEIIKGIGGFNSAYDGSQDYDVMFRCIEKAESIHHIAKSLYHWRMHEGSTALDPESKMYCYIAGQNAIQAHLDRTGIKAKAEMMPKPLFGLYHVKYDIPNALVSIIIPNNDHADVLKTCIDSLFNVNAYTNIEIIIVENNSKEQKTFDYYQQLQSEHSNIKVIFWKENEFNYSAVNNFGEKKANGEYLLFLNNDTEMIKPDAISEMLGLCNREDVGIVGAKLLYADNTIQHAGVIVGFSGYAGHVFNDIPNMKDYGYMTRDVVNCDLSAVTAACMMTKKSVFESVGGFDEQFKIACNDIDYCMKVTTSGKLVVYNAFSLWHHYESKSRGYENGFKKIVRFDREVERWQNKWMPVLLTGDPNYNRNFKIEDGPFELH